VYTAGEIVGITIGCLVFIGGAYGIWYCFRRPHAMKPGQSGYTEIAEGKRKNIQ
jgi:hypothetical protein